MSGQPPRSFQLVTKRNGSDEDCFYINMNFNDTMSKYYKPLPPKQRKTSSRRQKNLTRPAGAIRSETEETIVDDDLTNEATTEGGEERKVATTAKLNRKSVTIEEDAERYAVDEGSAPFKMRLPTMRLIDSDGRTTEPHNKSRQSSKTKSISSSPPPEYDYDDDVCSRSTLKRVAMHGALFLSVVAYIVLGGLMFQVLEREQEEEMDVKVLLDKIRANLPENISDELEEKLRGILSELNDEQETSPTISGVQRIGNSWSSIPAAILFAFTAVSTIGYGHIFPVTNLGRVVCICYTICGIPLFMIAVADVGKFLWQAMRWSMGSRMKENSLVELPLPVAVCFLLSTFTAYLVIGALVLPVFEDRTFLQSFYFCFISLTTVGFGDIIPENPYFLAVVLIYIFFGLALTTLAIEVLAAAIRRFHYWGYPIKGARMASVWVGGKLMNIDNILRSMARELGVQELEMQHFEDSLDRVLEKTVSELRENGHINLDETEAAITSKLADYRAKRSKVLEDLRRYSGVYDNIPDSWTAAMKLMIYMDQDEKLLIDHILDLHATRLDNIPLNRPSLL